jgi:hypothetical protein
MSIWSQYGVSDFPLNQPMVGQKEFYDIFKGFAKSMKNAGLATIFPLIAKWGVGKSRIAFELVSETLGMDKKWIVSEDGEQKQVRIFKEHFGDGVLPIYIRYSQMAHDDLTGDSWVGFAAYTALACLSKKPDAGIQGKIMEALQSELAPMGFDRNKLQEILKVSELSPDDLAADIPALDIIIDQAVSYLKKFGIEHILVICDELETAGEIARFGLEKEEEAVRKVDGEAIKVITTAIKHEDPRKKYPYLSLLLLCSPVIGDSIQGIGALDRRTEMCEMVQNSFADIADFIDYLEQENFIQPYPEGLVEAAYTIAGGNFGWFNVIMANVDQYLQEHPGADTGEIFESLLRSSSRFQKSLIDKDAFDYIRCEDKYRPLVKTALLKQLPAKKDSYLDEERQALLLAKAEDGEKLFKEFYCVRISKDDLGAFLNTVGYRRDAGNLFINDFGGKFDLDILLKSLKTFSINVKENEFITGAEKETFLDQVRMLYPAEDIEEAAQYIYQYIMEKVTKNDIASPDYIGPSFAYLYRLNKRYQADRGEFGYLLDGEKNKELEKHLETMRKDKKNEMTRVLYGVARALEISYPEILSFDIDGVPGVRTNVEEGPFLDVHPKKIVDIIWGKEEDRLTDVLKSNKLLKDGVHPIIVVSDSIFDETLVQKIKKDYPEAGRCLIFVSFTRIQKEILEVMSVEKELVDFRETANQITTAFKEKIRKIRDHLLEWAKKWFDGVDEAGWVLRPIVHKKHDQGQIRLIAKAFQRMLVHNATFEELGSMPTVKLDDGEYADLNSLLKNTTIGKILENKGYRETGLFVREQDSYAIKIPPCMVRMLQFVGDGRKSRQDFEARFFFSCIDKVKPTMLLGQWLDFLKALGLLLPKEGFLERIAKQDLDHRYNMVKSWFEKDYHKELAEMKKLIDGPYLQLLVMQNTAYQEKLDDAGKIKDSIRFELLTSQNKNLMDNWREVLTNLDEFYQLCYQIFDKKEWDACQHYNPNIIKKLKINDPEKPLWYRVRHIRLFLDYIRNLKEPAAEMVRAKIEEMKNQSVYRSQTLPISPLTNILKRYRTELEYATDYKTLTTYKTMVKTTSTLAYCLQSGDYGAAVHRLEEILTRCGIEGREVGQLSWSENDGLIGEYKDIYRSFKVIVDCYLDNLQEAKKWGQYFLNAPDNLKKWTEVKNLNNYINTLEISVNGGLQQEIDDKEVELADQPEELLQVLKSSLENMVQIVGLIEGHKNNVKDKAREERNKLYDHLLITAVDKLRRISGKAPVSVEIDETAYPQEESYTETLKAIKEKMNALQSEGEKFFDQNPKARKSTFNFFKQVIDADGELNWNEYAEEKQELESMKLIRTRVEVL